MWGVFCSQWQHCNHWVCVGMAIINNDYIKSNRTEDELVCGFSGVVLDSRSNEHGKVCMEVGFGATRGTAPGTNTQSC